MTACARPSPGNFRNSTDNWERIDIDFQEQQDGVCNSVCVGNKKVVMEKAAVHSRGLPTHRPTEPRQHRSVCHIDIERIKNRSAATVAAYRTYATSQPPWGGCDG